MKPPRIEIELAEDQRHFSPGDFLMCEFRLRAVEGLTVHAIETSVVWIAGGKGSEDIGVHFFQRISKDAINPSTLQGRHRLSTVLPHSPLTYPGQIVSIRWCVRVRMFYGDDLELNEDLEFGLGNSQVPESRNNLSNDDANDAASQDSQSSGNATVETSSSNNDEAKETAAYAPKPR